MWNPLHSPTTAYEQHLPYRYSETHIFVTALCSNAVDGKTLANPAATDEVNQRRCVGERTGSHMLIHCISLPHESPFCASHASPRRFFLNHFCYVIVWTQCANNTAERAGERMQIDSRHIPLPNIGCCFLQNSQTRLNSQMRQISFLILNKS